MTPYRELVRMLGIVVTQAQDRACRYLEHHGFRFCVDFGYENAIDKAPAFWRSRKRKRWS